MGVEFDVANGACNTAVMEAWVCYLYKYAKNKEEWLEFYKSNDLKEKDVYKGGAEMNAGAGATA